MGSSNAEGRLGDAGGAHLQTALLDVLLDEVDETLDQRVRQPLAHCHTVATRQWPRRSHVAVGGLRGSVWLCVDSVAVCGRRGSVWLCMDGEVLCLCVDGEVR